jgi:hypothetical protein
MSRTLYRSLVWGAGAGVVTGALLSPLSFGIAHGSGLWPLFLGGVLAISYRWPGWESPFVIAAYQFEFACSSRCSWLP